MKLIPKLIFTDVCEPSICDGGNCKIENHKMLCTCPTGYLFKDKKCVDLNECLSSPCPLNSKCFNTLGSYKCECVNGTVQDTITGSCKLPGDCVTDDDCTQVTKCFNNHCVNPCEKLSPCGENANCLVTKHKAECECPSDSQGDPYKKCIKFECTKDNHCPQEEACVNNKCKNACSLPRACGRNADCFSKSHVGNCICSPGYTGDPVLGCVPIQYCTTDDRCSSGTKCVDNLCVGKFRIFSKSHFW